MSDSPSGRAGYTLGDLMLLRKTVSRVRMAVDVLRGRHRCDEWE